MSVRIRLSKIGKTHQVSYRIVVQDARTKRDGKFLENLGFYNPHNKESDQIKIDAEKLKSWTKKGARPTMGVAKLLEKNGRSDKTST